MDQPVYRYVTKYFGGQPIDIEEIPDGQIDLAAARRYVDPRGGYYHAEMYRTPDGRWCRHGWDDSGQTGDAWEWVTAEEAREDMAEWGLDPDADDQPTAPKPEGTPAMSFFTDPETALRVVTNVEVQTADGYTTGWIVPADTPDNQVAAAALTHVDIPATEDPDEWQQGLRNALDLAGYAIDGVTSQDGSMVFAAVKVLGDRQYTAWLTTDAGCLEDAYADVVVRRDENNGVDVDDDGNEVPRWESTGAPLMDAKTTVNVYQDYYDVHSRAQEEAETLLLDAGWRAADDWEWQPVPSGYVVTVERGDA